MSNCRGFPHERLHQDRVIILSQIAVMKKVLFICSQNKLRSPTAEAVFAEEPRLLVASAGLNNNAEVPVTPELLKWADIIFVMEKSHRNKLSKKFKKYLNKQRVVCLEIPDSYGYMDPVLVSLLKAKVSRHLGTY
ncbi:low molecular weight protein tyrosine phosphatase family protein [Moorena sp. SIO3H5]|uniref:low molecular weight protein tyrosine phosphatase family protein n=1 Tax=Moorena sp. SIO3H5 TaxID=2607834 RepID=UPI0025DBAF5C|nr:low molecular weight protein tyrosine phosphatase family protein [Moorena sp. SIO3H5]